MTELDEKLAAVGAMWGGADYEQFAARFAPIHDRLVERLAPRPGERFLDVATGTGEVALRAARAGADVVGVDISEPLLEQARAKAERESLTIAFDVGDAQRLPYDDGAFDAVSSCFGAIFAPDHAAVARELARVCRAGGRLGIAAWVRSEELKRLWEPFMDEIPVSEPDAWGDEPYVRALLDGAFELDVERGEWGIEADSAEEAWELVAGAAPPVKALLEKLDERRRGELRAAAIDYYARHEIDGGVRDTREYVLVFGTRR